MGKGGSSLTSIAYACGYFDQSHFIREFKSFTGDSPSSFNIGNTTALLASPNK
jgi:AraC-like DNA-binding protein